MLVPIARFFQRYALFFSLTAGVTASHLILPNDSSKWLKFAVTVAVILGVRKLLYDDEVTGIRANGKPGLSVLAIVGYSLLYWWAYWFLLMIVFVRKCGSVADPLALDRCLDWTDRYIMVSASVAAIAYAFGMWAAIRARRASSG